MMETQPIVNLLSNEPCREDAFEGHSHRNIASQIARLIKEDDKRHIIGIEGGWGSGKSNLISLVNKSLNGEDVYNQTFDHKASKYPFFVYDAWGHQADYQRRAILEELTQELTVEKEILNHKKWDNKFEELLAKRKKTTTKEVPKLGFGLIMCILLCVLTPLILYFINFIPEDKWWWRLLMSVVPYILGFVWVYFDRRKSIKENGQKPSFANILAESILVYKDKIKENETYTTISEKEPSSTEFKAWMDEVDKDLTAQEKILVIVFDNMDRLPSQKVENLWSSIHSFFSDKTYGSIRVLIPFDRKHVQSAFKNEDTDKESFGNDFINKTFDVVFRVPPPIMTGWQSYMADLWKKAFGANSELDSSVTQIYEALNKNHTPRKIIAFINEIATVKMTMGGDIPDRYIALFVIGKEKIDTNPIDELLNPSFLGEIMFEYEKDPNTIKYLSALYYQLPADKALDVVFTKEATNALNSGNAERLEQIKDRIDLKPILSKAILGVTEIEKASVTLSKLDDFYGFTDYRDMPVWLKQIWKALYHKCLSMDVIWNEIQEFHVLLFTHLYDESLADNLIKGYLGIEDDNLDVGLYVETVDRLRENNDIIDRKLEQHKRKVSPKLFLDLLRFVDNQYDNYGVSYDLDELDTYLSGLERDKLLSLNKIPSIGIKEESLHKYKTHLQELINTETDDLDTDDICRLFDRLKEVAEKPLDFEEFFSDKSIYSEWINLSDEKHQFRNDLLSMRLARRSNFNSSYSSQFNAALEESDDVVVESLAKVIEYYISFGDLLLHSEYYKRYPLVCKVIKLLLSNSYGEKKANIMACLMCFDHAVFDYGIDSGSFFTTLNAWVDQVSFAKTKVESLPSGLVEIAVATQSKLSDAIRTACMEHYVSQTQDQWKDHMLKKDDTYRIWKLYHPKKYQANFDALKMVLKEYAEEAKVKQPDKGIIAEWLTLCLELKHSVKALFNDISATLKRDSGSNKAKLLFFGGYILEYADPEKQSDFIQKLIPTEMIDSDVITFIFDHLDRLKECEISDEFREKIKHLAETSLKEDKHIVTICKVFGIEVNNPGALNS